MSRTGTTRGIGSESLVARLDPEKLRNRTKPGTTLYLARRTQHCANTQAMQRHGTNCAIRLPPSRLNRQEDEDCPAAQCALRTQRRNSGTVLLSAR